MPRLSVSIDIRSSLTYLLSVPTLTVAMIFGVPGTLRAKHVNSKNDECSEYGTPAR